MPPASKPQHIDADLAYAAAQVVVETHRRVAAFLHAGLKLPEVDAFIARQLADQGAKSCFLGYTPQPRRLPPFPSHACLSVNECVVHGTAGYFPRELREGDLFKVDIGVWFKGWVGDAAWTYSIGKPAPLAARLMECGKKSLAEGVKELHPAKTYAAWARRVQSIVETEYGFHLVRGLGGHGLFDEKRNRPTLHGPPFVANRMPDFPGEWTEVNQKCLPGTLIAVEPMIAVGTGELLDKGAAPMAQRWPELSADRSLTVHYEHDVLITEAGPRVLTEGLENTTDIII
ncbi:MAG: M24 family metallopeptidase [Phycisphaerales bacterium]